MRVLVAEDNPLSQHLLLRCLNSWGYQPVLAATGIDAWQAFQADPFPLVLSDWMMPLMDGPELIRRIRATPTPSYTYILMLTARTQKGDVVAGMDAGADDFLGKPFDVDELRVRLRAGERVVRLERDLAEQNRTLRETEAALVQSEKLASLGRLAAGMAHEINNPLAFVTNNLTVLRRETQVALDVLDLYREGRVDEAARREQEADLAYFRAHFVPLCERTLGGLQRVRDIVKNLRDFACLDEAEFNDVDLNASVRSALEIAGHELRKKAIDLQTSFAELPPVPCQPGKINQVFLHLLVNAAEACEPNGKMAVRTRVERGQAIVEVQDNGHGIAPEHRPRLFEPFFTTKPIGEGTGLGLSVSFAIVRDHGGTIEVDSEPGRGSTFRIRLPLRSENPNTPGQAETARARR